MRNKVEEIEAVKLEAQGYIVIRAFKRGCPDIIAIHPSAVGLVIAREVKAGKDKPSQAQEEVIKGLKNKGVDAHFHFVPTNAQPSEPDSFARNRIKEEKLTPDQRIEQEKPWVLEGYNSLQTGTTLKEFLSPASPYSALWYRMRAAFKIGVGNALRERVINGPVRYPSVEFRRSKPYIPPAKLA